MSSQPHLVEDLQKRADRALEDALDENVEELALVLGRAAQAARRRLRAVELYPRILAHVAAHPGQTGNEVVLGVVGERGLILRALRDLAKARRLWREADPTCGAFRWTIRPGGGLTSGEPPSPPRKLGP